MSTDIRPRVRIPKSSKPGEVVLIKTLVTHPMESGLRRDASGAIIPRSIINRFTAELNGAMIVDMTLEQAISSNPYIEFEARVDQPGEFVFTWHDDEGTVYTDRKPIEVG
jgi:sulfur-oxidizing protein SoxZ